MTSLRLLVPVGKAKSAQPGVRYAAHSRARREVDVCLLHVEQPANRWDMLRPANAQQAASQRRAERTLAAVSEELQAEGIVATAFLRAGAPVFTILDAAEQLDCDEIVVPRPCRGWRRLFCRGIVSALLRQQRGIPVVVVDGDGRMVEAGS